MSDRVIEDQVRQLAEALDVALLLREVEPARYVYVSAGFERIFGRPVAALLDDPTALIAFAHPDDRDIVAARAADLSVESTPEVEWRVVRPDGSIRWVRAKRAFVAASVGQPDRIAGFLEDITERKAAETALDQSREWFDALSDAVPIGFAIRDAETRDYVYVSSAYEQIFGRPRQDFYDDPAASFSLTHPDDLAILGESVAMASSGEPWSYEGRIMHRDGKVRWLRGYQVGTSGAGSTRRWLASTVEDVTERRAKEAQLRCLVDANIVGVMIADQERVIDANDRYLQIVGYTRSDLAEGLLSWRKMTPPTWLAVTTAAANDVEERGACAPYEKEFFRKDGSRVPVLIGSALLEREPLTFSSFVLDLSETKQVESALRQAEADAQRANEAKSAFLSRMSHELRTPLNAVIGFGQLLTLDKLSADQRESVDQILKGGNHLLALINEVLDISRIESGELRLSLEPVKLADVVEETIALVRHLGGVRHVTITDRCPPGCDAHVRADRQRIKQAVLNLLSNAIKYNNEYGQVELECAPVSPTRVRLIVSDTGIGIAEAHMGRLFAPFDRLGAEQTDVEGVGLGLALTRRLVEAMGGTIGATSVAGEGSTFWIELETATADPNAGLAVIPPPEPNPITPARHVTVLYIEDNLANVRLVQRILAQRGDIETIVAIQASLGLELARAHLPNLILLDLNLPDMPGVEALRRLRADPVTASIPVVVISADATAGQISWLRQEGAVDYLSKPFDIKRFLDIVDNHTGVAGNHTGAARPSDEAPSSAGRSRIDVEVSSIDRPLAVLDPNVVESLRELAAGAQAVEFARTVEVFLEDCRSLIVTICAMATRNDARGLGTAAHNLRGTAANYGALRLAKTAAELEVISDTGDLAGIAELIGDLDGQFIEAAAALRAEFSR